MKLSRTKCYVGEPVILQLTVYMGGDVRNLQFDVPMLEDANFSLGDVPASAIPNNVKRFSVPLPGGEAIGFAGIGKLDGRDYNTITFGKVLIPKKAGSSKAACFRPCFCEVLVGHRNVQSPFWRHVRRRSFFNQQQGVYNQVP